MPSRRFRVYPKRIYADIDRKGKRMRVTYPLEASRVVDYDDHSNQYTTIYQDGMFKVRWSKEKMLYLVVIGKDTTVFLEDYQLAHLSNKRRWEKRRLAINEHFRITGYRAGPGRAHTRASPDTVYEGGSNGT